MTTDASCGAVNGMHDSFTPLGGLVPLFNIQLGEVVFGGVGAGLYGMLVMAILSVFIAGLMVGRTPEYLGKKIETKRSQAGDAVRAGLPARDPGFTAWSVVTPYGVSSLNNAGPHGLSEILYAFTSAAGQQRLGVRGPEREHPLVQRDARPGDARRALPDDRAGPGDRGHHGRQEGRRAGARHAPDHRPAVRGPARRA